MDRLRDELDGYAEMAEPHDPDLELPVFWHVPKSGGTALQDLTVHCIEVVGANEIGGKYAADAGSLEVVRLENENRKTRREFPTRGISDSAGAAWLTS